MRAEQGNEVILAVKSTHVVKNIKLPSSLVGFKDELQ
jgi:hypothetical protein